MKKGLSPIFETIVDSLRNYPAGCLMILSEGISIPDIVSLFLSYHQDPSNLIFLLNFSPSELDLADSNI
jgi:hypothetical protein